MNLIPVGTIVYHFGYPVHIPGLSHGKGTVVAYNNVPKNEYAEEKIEDAAELAAQAGLMQALVSSLYDGTRYPYVVQWDNGYKDVYGPESLTTEVTQLEVTP